MTSNPLMSALNNGTGNSTAFAPFANMTNMFKQFGEFKKNPVQYLVQRNFNVPQNFNGSPKELVDHLVNTNQISQEQLSQMTELAKQMQSVFPK